MSSFVSSIAAASSEVDRLAELHDYHILDSLPEMAFDRLARAAADLCDAPMALISLVDNDRQWFKSRIGVEVSETPRAHAFCAHAIQQGSPLVVRNAALDPRFAENPLVTGDLNLRFYAGAPLTTARGHRLGTLCILDRKERRDGLTDSQSRVLVALAAQVVNELELRKTLAQMQHLINHDPLTGLANRLLFQKRLEVGIVDAADADRRGAVVLLDLDHFKYVNDVYGHRSGDNLLKIVAQRLKDFIRRGETVARLGGDEFTLVLPDCGDIVEVEARISQLISILSTPIDIDGHQLDARASVGVACFPDHGNDPTTLLKHADVAMYRAKAAGRGTMRMYRYTQSTALERRLEVLQSVRAAIGDGRIFPYYQAQTSLDTGATVGSEALLRMCDRDGVVCLPGEIEDAIEDGELGISLGVCMMRQIVNDLRGWTDAGIAVGHVAVNASAVELRGDYAAMVLATFADAGISPTLLQIEVTESVFLGRGSSRVEATLRTLADAGVRIALDDFGTGFASLTHLKKFPISIIKIDRSFIRGLGTDPDDTAIVQAVIGLATNLGMEVVAEGVETRAQARQLRKMGCTLVQGYYFHNPSPREAFSATFAGRAPAVNGHCFQKSANSA